MNTPLRAALAILTGATLLVVASCTSSPESAPPSTTTSTASAWVKPLESASGSASTFSEPSDDGDSAIASSPTQSLPAVSISGGPDSYFSAAPLPTGLSEADQRQAVAAVDTYARYWSLTNRLGANPNVDSAAQIAEVATGTAATELEKSFQRFRENGLRVTGQNAVVVRVQRVEAGAVDLQLCVDGSEGRVVDSAGTPVDDDVDRQVRRPGTARVGEYVSGWKVDTNVFQISSSC